MSIYPLISVCWEYCWCNNHHCSAALMGDSEGFWWGRERWITPTAAKGSGCCKATEQIAFTTARSQLSMNEATFHCILVSDTEELIFYEWKLKSNKILTNPLHHQFHSNSYLPGGFMFIYRRKRDEKSKYFEHMLHFVEFEFGVMMFHRKMKMKMIWKRTNVRAEDQEENDDDENVIMYFLESKLFDGEYGWHMNVWRFCGKGFTVCVCIPSTLSDSHQQSKRLKSSTDSHICLTILINSHNVHQLPFHQQTRKGSCFNFWENHWNASWLIGRSAVADG